MIKFSTGRLSSNGQFPEPVWAITKNIIFLLDQPLFLWCFASSTIEKRNIHGKVLQKVPGSYSFGTYYYKSWRNADESPTYTADNSREEPFH